MSGLEKLILRHRTVPWKGSDVLAISLKLTIETLQRIMMLNKAEDMRVMAAKTIREVEDMVREK